MVRKKKLALNPENISCNCIAHVADPKEDKVIVLDGKQVIVPQGRPVKNPKAKNTSFYCSEYLVYQESQVRLRYLIKFDWSN